MKDRIFGIRSHRIKEIIGHYETKAHCLTNYDKYYQTEGLFGAPYPELIEFFEIYKPEKEVDRCGLRTGAGLYSAGQHIGYCGVIV